MSEYFVYMDETGTLDFGPPRSATESPYFGFGSVIFPGEHGDVIWDGHVLRASLESRGVKIPSQFHAKNDTWETRGDVFSLIASQAPRFDATLLRKERAQAKVIAAGKPRLYKIALYLHLKFLCQKVFSREDSLYVVVATIGTRAMKTAAEAAIIDVAAQMPQNVVACFWDSASTWGLQVADYLLWARQRELSGRPLSIYDSHVQPLVKSTFFPWGEA